MADTYQMLIAGIPVEVVRKQIKHLHVGVYPPAGHVRIAAPLRLADEALRIAVISRLGWIRRRQAAFEQQARETRREFVSGESHYFQGRRYRLDVIEREGPSTIALRNNKVMSMYVPPGTETPMRAQLLDTWYRTQLRAQLPSLLTKWLPRIGVPLQVVRLRKMKTLWGSCNAESGRIWLNIELAKKDTTCLEFILVHELVHLLERHHNDRFLATMDRLLPNWRHHRDELNRSPLAHQRFLRNTCDEP